MTDPAADRPGDLARLAIHLETGFVTTPAGRLERVNDPDRSLAPRLVLAGCPGGRFARLRHDVDDETAATAAEWAARLGASTDASDDPDIPSALWNRLAGPGSPGAIDRRLVHDLPADAVGGAPAPIVAHHTAEGVALARRLATEGMPRPLADAGFLTTADFWPPWCVALADGEIAAVAFAARLGPRGADVGVHTLAGYRGRGLGAAVTAAWAALPTLGDRLRFYTVSPANRASLRVAERLGLRLLGASVSIG